MIKEGIIKYRLNKESKIVLERNTEDNSFKFTYSPDIKLHEFINDNIKLMQELHQELISSDDIAENISSPNGSEVVQNVIQPVKNQIDNFIDRKFSEATQGSKSEVVPEEMIEVSTPLGVQVIPKSFLTNQVRGTRPNKEPQKIEQQAVVQNGIGVVKPIVNPNSLKNTANNVKLMA